MRSVVKVVLATALAAGVAAVATGCSSADPEPPAAPAASATGPSTGPATTPATPAATPATGVVVVDVRTPEEFAAGHLDGALSLDVRAADFAERAGDLDPDAAYVLYCRSGSRAAAAAQQLADLGFADVTNAGGLDEAAAATGLAVVTS